MHVAVFITAFESQTVTAGKRCCCHPFTARVLFGANQQGAHIPVCTCAMYSLQNPGQSFAFCGPMETKMKFVWSVGVDRPFIPA